MAPRCLFLRRSKAVETYWEDGREAPEKVTLVQGDPDASDGESPLIERIRGALEDRLEALPAFALER